MMRRARDLGGRVTLASRPGETVLTLRLPRERRAAAVAPVQDRRDEGSGS